jgi:flagellar basal body-associated protein FliL
MAQGDPSKQSKKYQLWIWVILIVAVLLSMAVWWYFQLNMVSG